MMAGSRSIFIDTPPVIQQGANGTQALLLTRCAWLLLLLAVPMGCGGAGGEGRLDATVTYEGQPLAEGVARFVPADGQGPTATAVVEAGRFSLRLPSGSYRVEFSAPKVTGKQKMYDTPDSPEVDVVEELLPEKYNVRSTLSSEIRAGRQQAAFDL